jgi:hypothetical protein
VILVDSGRPVATADPPLTLPGNGFVVCLINFDIGPNLGMNQSSERCRP